MNDVTDPQLLRDYAERRSEAAFAELVRRMLTSSIPPQLAGGIASSIFANLARDAGNHRLITSARNAR